MTALLKKLNFKDEEKFFVLNAPESFKEEISAMSAWVQIVPEISKTDRIELIMVFVHSASDIKAQIHSWHKQLEPDAKLWLAYPKKSSKKYSTDITRDVGWDPLAEIDYEPVRMVAIDSDWSALRFRDVRFIKTMKRSFAKTELGKKKVKDSS